MPAGSGQRVVRGGKPLGFLRTRVSATRSILPCSGGLEDPRLVQDVDALAVLPGEDGPAEASQRVGQRRGDLLEPIARDPVDAGDFLGREGPGLGVLADHDQSGVRRGVDRRVGRVDVEQAVERDAKLQLTSEAHQSRERRGSSGGGPDGPAEGRSPRRRTRAPGPATRQPSRKTSNAESSMPTLDSTGRPSNSAHSAR